jgi:hypothetical protein
MSTQAQKTFDVSRKQAADIMNVSTRTLDRYIKSKKLSSKSIAGRIMLNRDEVDSFKKTRTHRNVKKNKSSKKKKVYEINTSYIDPEKSKAPENTEEKVYKKLYEELRQEVRVFQQRLEGANYRVGQLESQVKSSVPLLDHQKVLTESKKHKYNKKILYILLGAILALQPLWLIMAYF